MPDVHVIGAGPAGSIAAISALRSGRSVLVSEDHAHSGIPRNCSGLMSKDGLESLRGFVDYRPFVQNRIKGADIHLGGERFSVRRSMPVAYVCDRAGFDQALAQNAADEGADMRYNDRIDDISKLRSDNVIGADGPMSFVARAFRFPRIAKHVATLQAELPHKSEDPSVIEMHISNTLFPGFFAWVIPHDECTAEFGVGVLSPHRAASAWNNLLKLKGISASTTPKPRGFVIPLRPRTRTAMKHHKRNVLLAGDAAGQVKCTTGGGVVFGGNCAAIAGRFAANPAGYEISWRARFGPDLVMHSMIHDYISSCPDARLSTLCRRIKRLNIDDYLSQHGHMDRPTRMVGPAAISYFLKNMGGMLYARKD
jgi:digeranylgeranylglycerophospholipid reductase